MSDTVRHKGQSMVCTVCEYLHLQFFTVRTNVAPSGEGDICPCVYSVRGPILTVVNGGEGESWTRFFLSFLNVTVIFLANVLQTGMGSEPVNETHPCSLCFPAHMLLKHESPLWLLGFRFTPFVLANPSPGVSLHVSRPHLVIPWELEGPQKGWQKKTLVNIGNVTFSFFASLAHFPAPQVLQRQAPSCGCSLRNDAHSSMRWGLQSLMLLCKSDIF